MEGGRKLLLLCTGYLLLIFCSSVHSFKGKLMKMVEFQMAVMLPAGVGTEVNLQIKVQGYWSTYLCVV